MSRLSRDFVNDRKNFVRELFRKNIQTTATEIQRELKGRFGKIMRPKTIYELRLEVKNEPVGGTGFVYPVDAGRNINDHIALASDPPQTVHQTEA